MDDRIPTALKDDPRFENFLKVWDELSGRLTTNYNSFDVRSAPELALYDLAATFGVLGYKGWLLATSTNNRQLLIESAISLHKSAGTPWSVVNAIKAAGYPNAKLVEGVLLPGGNSDPFAVTIELDSFATIDIAANGVPATVRELIEKVAKTWLPVYVRLDSITLRIVIILDGSRLLNGSTLLNGLPT